MNKNLLIGISGVALVGLLGIGYLALSGRNQPTTVADLAVPTSGGAQPTSSENVKNFAVNGSNFSFDPAEVKVKKGDTVKITFKDDDGRHNLVVDGYNVSTNIIEGGSEDSIQFVADKSGTFDYFCSVDSHREKGMIGKLIVE